MIPLTAAATAFGMAKDIGSTLAPIFSIFGQKSANDQNLQIARENRDWQERMSNTAHTREVADLRNAGLNPILSATGGQGASTPTGSIAQMESITEKGSQQLMEKAQLKLNTAKTGAELENISADTQNKSIQNEVLQAQVDNTVADTAIKNIEVKLKDKDLSWYDKKTLVDMQTKLITAQASKVSASASQENAKANMINASTGTPWKTGIDIVKNASKKWKW